jgi:hypothetical protein
MRVSRGSDVAAEGDRGEEFFGMICDAPTTVEGCLFGAEEDAEFYATGPWRDGIGNPERVGAC